MAADVARASGSSAQMPTRSQLRTVAVPTEHGGWGLTLEPVLLGLLVEPGAAGALLGAAALLTFLIRTPVKVVLVDRRRGRRLERTALAERVAAVESVLLIGSVVGAVLLADAAFWAPFVLAAPLVAVELWFDARSRSRRLVPELAGATAMGSVASAIVLAGGGSAEIAAGVWLLIAARVLASVPFVRLQLRRAKGHPEGRPAVDVAQAGAVVVAAVGWWLGWLPPVAPVAVAVLAVVQVVLARTDPPRAAIVGAQQVVLGLSVVLITALGILAP